jgi:hypothetical protein
MTEVLPPYAMSGILYPLRTKRGLLEKRPGSFRLLVVIMRVPEVVYEVVWDQKGRSFRERATRTSAEPEPNSA